MYIFYVRASSVLRKAQAMNSMPESQELFYALHLYKTHSA
jgi:hypothetical protein